LGRVEKQAAEMTPTVGDNKAQNKTKSIQPFFLLHIIFAILPINDAKHSDIDDIQTTYYI